ncbi:MAG: hypothetical protein DI526_03305 [Caulobacter segnis]|uniref:DUF1376 domain-containing protein n=2 Tax=Caulobacter segnis TaxID=88688 RepID=A0A2W5VFC1_9CAUL|nr:MAG: hypothetical protein DI526_03305 [Caulobacter segnis]
MPLVIGDYRKDTGRLTTEQHGAYLLLIMDYWISGPPADDDEDLMAITGLDAKSWKKQRPKLLRYFRVEDGVWRHKRIDEELERWARKKEVYASRAAAGGRAKAAKSTPQAHGKKPSKHENSAENACLSPAPQPASTEEEDPSGSSSLSGGAAVRSSVPADVRAAFAKALTPEWELSYIAPGGWIAETRTIVPVHEMAAGIIRRDGRRAMAALEEAGTPVLVDAKARAA